MYHENPDIWKNLLRTGLQEDGWPWDWTAIGTLSSKNSKIRAKVVAKSNGVWAAKGLVLALPLQGNAAAALSKWQSPWKDGERFESGDVLATITGSSMEILALERPFLNLAAYVCGIATSTSKLVERVKKACPHNPPRICLTRKTLPHYRDIAIHGVRMGGGYPHRVSLSGGVLIKENHIAAAGSIPKAVEGAKKSAPHGLKIEIEVRDLKELRESLRSGVDGVLLDNFHPDQVREAIQILGKNSPRPFLEVSGGINLENVSQFALEGVDVLSVGSITHSVTSSDFSLLIQSK